jgi:K+-sensing histidine kinase KdpD
MTDTTVAGGRQGLALRERGIIVRVSAATLAVVNSIMLVAALGDPEIFGLSTSVTLALGLPHIAVETVLAALPWQRLLQERPRPWLFRGHVAYNVLGLFAAVVLADGVSTQALWLLAFNLVYSALILPTREHVVVAVASVAGAGATVLATTGLSLGVAVELTGLAGIAVLASIGSAVVWGALQRAERARDEADDSADALRDALVAVHTTSSGDIDRILAATVRAAVRGPNDMAGVHVLDGDQVRTAFERVPEDMQFHDEELLRGIIAGIDRHGSAVLDHEQAHPELLPTAHHGRVRFTMIAPARRDGRVLGALVVGRADEPAFSNGERAALELLADHVARGVVLSHDMAADRATMERLRELDRMKRDFVATVSHEMRTPLTVISGLSETLHERGHAVDDDMRATLVARLRSNAASLERIVTGLLDIAGIDRGLLVVEQSDIDLTRLLGETAARLESLFDDHELVLQVEDDLRGSGDLALLERVLENLLTNAQRHTPPGTTVRLVGRHAADGALVVEVADDGPGIPAEDLQSVLGRFVRGGTPNERSTRGLGLGLALADEVLRLHTSQLEVTSVVGQGTTFSFRLAAVPAPSAITGEPTTTATGSSAPHR